MGDVNLLNQQWKGDPSAPPMKPTAKLVATTFEMLVSRSQVISPMYADLIGVPASRHGSESVAQHGMITASLNGPRIAEVFAIGGKPMFKNVRDSVRLYKILVDYLLGFRAAYENDVIRLNSNDNMMANVLKLENLAEWVFTIAKPYIPAEEIHAHDSLAARIGRGRFTRGMFGPKDPVKVDKDAGFVIVTHGGDSDGASHGRITDTVMEQHFSHQTKNGGRNSSGWR